MKINEDGYILSCPSCDSKDLIKKSRQKNYDGSYKQRYMCKGCGSRTVNPQLLDADIVRSNVLLAKQNNQHKMSIGLKEKDLGNTPDMKTQLLAYYLTYTSYYKSVVFQKRNSRKLNKVSPLVFFKYLIHTLTNLFPYLIIPTILRLLQGV